MWTVKLPHAITTIEVVDYKPKSFKAVLVALSNCEVHVYKVCICVLVFNTIHEFAGEGQMFKHTCSTQPEMP